MATDAVPLTRSFSPVPKSEAGADKEALRSLWGHQKQTGWEELEKEFRCVILAEAGAGKTFEITARAALAGAGPCAQENELANQQRTDILLQSPAVSSPVPIELKLLDKGWTGPALCERLRNQLAGDYLREHTAGHGILLLVWQGRTTSKRWQIGTQRVGREDLPDALHQYWESVSDQFPGVSGIRVVLIDLTVRDEVSGV